MQGFPLVYSPYAPVIAAMLIPLIFIVIVWTLALKGYALWCAARGSQKWWFIALLIVNTLGILEIVYLIWFRRKNDTKKEPTEPPVTVSSSAP